VHYHLHAIGFAPPSERHPAAITTEEYWYCVGSAEYCDAVRQSQLDWLDRDLAAVDRTVTPWVIAYGHKQGWMDGIGPGNWSKIEAIMQKHGVDMYFTGHIHSECAAQSPRPICEAGSAQTLLASPWPPSLTAIAQLCCCADQHSLTAIHRILAASLLLCRRLRSHLP
jgi:hypothetical protein